MSERRSANIASAMPAPTAFFTICAKNYLGYARTLQQSLAASYPNLDFFIFLADSTDGVDRLAAPPESNVVTLDDLRLDRLSEMAFKYSVLEFSTSIKPHCFQYLFNTLEYEHAIYLDPDIYVLRPLEHVETALAQGASCVLTPHIARPLDDGHHPSDIDILSVGVFNLGFAAFRNDSIASSYLSWWRAACEEACYVKMERGIFVDQKYCDLAPCFMPSMVQLSHPGYNLAYWNLAHRKVRQVGDDYSVDELPLYFVHFSGIDVADPERFSKYQNRYLRKDLGDLMPLYDLYIKKLKDNDNAKGELYSRNKYAFDYFKNGERITRTMRRQYATLINNKLSGIDPFELDSHYFNTHAPEATERSILSKLLLSPTFMVRNLMRRLTKGRARTARYWERRIGPLSDE